ncbi:pirin family protein [Pseudonocardia sp. HH130630-07]|uniref:pirin family protein n=1 Tax=Pseudonocardia sp. HH130630-07 TaxID=1690815 RepID=UPI0008152D17|nr:pirin family protein [Pseudonocardia sp. HH130630-07]ANY08455.1 quercetin 2,3-dioxygenase [Pseudonocardia sp. HH130630-07]
MSDDSDSHSRPGSRVTVQRAQDRFRTATGWLDSRHSFSAGAHYDPANTHFGLLLLHNEDRVSAGLGYDEHPHRDTEILTWVLEGELEHRDSGSGRVERVGPGTVQRLGAGSGVRHSEHATAAAGVRFVQMWVVPDAPGGAPEYELRDAPAGPGAVVLASGLARHRDERLLPLRQSDAALTIARLAPGDTIDLPAAPYVHAFAARGTLDVEAAPGLDTGDALRVVGDGGRRCTAGPQGAEILLWEMHTALGRT